MKTGFWPIVKGVITFAAFTAIVSAALVFITNIRETDSTLNDIVVPQLNYLVKADSSNKARDKVMACKIDSTRIVVDFLAKDFVTKKANDPTLTTWRFLEEIGELKVYIDDIKKNESPTVYERSFHSLPKRDIHSPEEWGIPRDWIPHPKTDLILTDRK